MDPISFAIELEIGSFLIAMVGATATWIHHRQIKAQKRMRERHYQELVALRERHHREHMQVLRGEEHIMEETAGNGSAAAAPPTAARPALAAAPARPGRRTAPAARQAAPQRAATPRATARGRARQQPAA